MQDSTEAPVSPLTILVVDDDKDVCEYLQDFLTADGYSVTCVNDPTTAIDALREREYHVAVLDLMMPKLSGIDLLEQIRKVDDDRGDHPNGYPASRQPPRSHEGSGLASPSHRRFREAIRASPREGAGAAPRGRLPSPSQEHPRLRRGG